MLKDPGLFPFRVGGAIAKTGRKVDSVRVVNGYGPLRMFRALVMFWRQPSGHLAILFHLNLRTLVFLLFAKCFAPSTKTIIKTDLTPVPKELVSFKQKITWRAISALAQILCVETPEALDMMTYAGIRNAVFLPNHIDIQGERGCDLIERSAILLVTREGDERKRPGHTLRMAQFLAGKGFDVRLVGIEMSGGESKELSSVSFMEKETLMKELQSAAAFVGLSESESFWFLVAEAVALGTPVLSTPTGIAPFLATTSNLVTLIKDVWDWEGVASQLQQLLVNRGTCRSQGFNISIIADQQMGEVIARIFEGLNV